MKARCKKDLFMDSGKIAFRAGKLYSFSNNSEERLSCNTRLDSEIGNGHKVRTWYEHFELEAPKEGYMLFVDGSNSPTFIHDDINSATTEAKRLHAITNKNVRILRMIGVVETIEVPVTEKRVVVSVYDKERPDDIPF
jgi:hypothetical protein